MRLKKLVRANLPMFKFQGDATTSQEACVEISTTHKVSLIYTNIDFNMLIQTFIVMLDQTTNL